MRTLEVPSIAANLRTQGANMTRSAEFPRVSDPSRLLGSLGVWALCAAVSMLVAACGPDSNSTNSKAAVPEAFNLTVQPGSIINVLIEVATKEGLWQKNGLHPTFTTAHNRPA